jgi:hypothetical protein
MKLSLIGIAKLGESKIAYGGTKGVQGDIPLFVARSCPLVRSLAKVSFELSATFATNPTESDNWPGQIIAR